MNASVWVAIAAIILSFLTALFAGWNRLIASEILVEVANVRLEIAKLRVDAAEWRTADRHQMRGEATNAVLNACEQMESRFELIDQKLVDVAREFEKRTDRIDKTVDQLVQRIHQTGR